MTKTMAQNTAERLKGLEWRYMGHSEGSHYIASISDDNEVYTLVYTYKREDLMVHNYKIFSTGGGVSYWHLVDEAGHPVHDLISPIIKELTK